MLKSVEDVASTKKRLTIEIPSEAIEVEIQKSLQEVQRRSRIPGFRPGKAPASIVEKRFGKEVESEVLEKVVPNFYAEALKEAALRPVAPPDIEHALDFKRNQSLTFTVAVEVWPKVEPLMYGDLTVKETSVVVTDEDIEKVLKNLAEERAAYESSNDGIARGDLVTLDYRIGEDGTEGKDMVVKVGSGPYPEELVAALLGKNHDDVAEVEATFPDGVPAPFGGKHLRVSLLVKEVKRRTVVPVDDEFAKDLGCEDYGALKDKVRQRLIAGQEREAERKKQAEIIDHLIAAHSFDIPEGMLNAEVAGMVGQVMAAAGGQQTEDGVREKVKPVAERNVRASILLQLIGEKEKIAVSEEELKEEVIGMAQSFQVTPEDVIKYHAARDGSLERLRQSVFEKKVLRFLLGTATVDKGA